MGQQSAASGRAPIELEYSLIDVGLDMLELVGALLFCWFNVNVLMGVVCARVWAIDPSAGSWHAASKAKTRLFVALAGAVPIGGTPGPVGSTCRYRCEVHSCLAKKRTVYFTPGVIITPELINDELELLTQRASICIGEPLVEIGARPEPIYDRKGNVELIILDESESLRATALELLRDRYDSTNIALMFVRMPGIEKKFAYKYRPVAQEEIHFVL